MIVVTITHVRTAKICVNGTRAWFTKHDLDFRDFLKNGIDAEILRSYNDPIVLRAIEQAELEHNSGR